MRQERNWGHSPERWLLLLYTRCAVSNMTGSQSSTFIFCEISVICFGWQQYWLIVINIIAICIDLKKNLFTTFIRKQKSCCAFFTSYLMTCFWHHNPCRYRRGFWISLWGFAIDAHYVLVVKLFMWAISWQPRSQGGGWAGGICPRPQKIKILHPFAP